MNFNVGVTNGSAYVVTPREVARLIVMTVCKHPIRIRNGYFEFLQFGIGLQPKNCTGQACGGTFEAYERDSVVTMRDFLTTPQTIRIYPSDSRDLNLQVLLQGKDANGQVILTTDPNTGTSAPGEYVRLAFPFVDSVYQYSVLNGLQKDQTYGPLQFFMVDPSTGVENQLSSMEPNEGTAQYRRYLINGIPNVNLCCPSPPNPVQITAQARLDFTPVENETDYLTIPNVPALIEEAISLRYNFMEQGQALSTQHHTKALALLVGQLDLYEGKVSTAIGLPLFGSQKLIPSFR